MWLCGLCCAPGTVTGHSFLISDSSFGVVARIVPIVACSHPLPPPSLRVTLSAVAVAAKPKAHKGSEGTKDRRPRYEGKQVKKAAPPVWPGSRSRRVGGRRRDGGN